VQNHQPPPENNEEAKPDHAAKQQPENKNETVTYNYNEFTGEIERNTHNEDLILKSAPKRAFDSYAQYSSIGFQMIAAMLLGALGGLQLDKRLHSSPWLTVIGTLIGVALAMYIIIKETAKPK
jgi:F0F1-type ATP synthase assembly protein I